MVFPVWRVMNQGTSQWSIVNSEDAWSAPSLGEQAQRKITKCVVCCWQTHTSCFGSAEPHYCNCLEQKCVVLFQRKIVVWVKITTLVVTTFTVTVAAMVIGAMCKNFSLNLKLNRNWTAEYEKSSADIMLKMSTYCDRVLNETSLMRPVGCVIFLILSFLYFNFHSWVLWQTAAILSWKMIF